MAKAKIEDVRAVLLSGAGPQQKIDMLEAMLLPDPAGPEVTNIPGHVEGGEYVVTVESSETAPDAA